MKKLTRLINALERSEKRYFKRYVGLYSDKEQDYMALYEIIEKHKPNSELSVKEKVAAAQIKHPLVKANYLYDLILDALIDYQKSKNVYFQLQDDIRQITVLRDKGLKKDASSLIKKAKEKALEKEAHLIYLDLLSIEYTVGGLDGQSEEWIQKARNNREEILKIYQTQQQKTEAIHINLEIQNLLAQQGTLSPQQVEDFFATYPILKQPNSSFTSKNFLNISNIKIMLYMTQKPWDFNRVCELIGEQVSYLESPQSKNLRKVEIYIVLNNSIFLFYVQKNIEFFKRSLAILNEVETPMKMFQNLKTLAKIQADFLLELLEPSLKKEEIEPFILEKEQQIREHKKPSIPIFNLYCYDALVCFCITHNKIQKANEWIEELVTAYIENGNVPLSIRGRMLKLILLYEQVVPTLIEREIKKFKTVIESYHQDSQFLVEIHDLVKKYKTITKLQQNKLKVQEIIKKIEKEESVNLKSVNVHIFLNWLKLKLV